MDILYFVDICHTTVLGWKGYVLGYACIIHDNVITIMYWHDNGFIDLNLTTRHFGYYKFTFINSINTKLKLS